MAGSDDMALGDVARSDPLAGHRVAIAERVELEAEPFHMAFYNEAATPAPQLVATPCTLLVLSAGSTHEFHADEWSVR